MSKRGRPVKSQIRQNIIEILVFLEKSHGYNIHKIYNEIFTPCTRENIYYNLRKGVLLGEFEMEIVKEKGNYSWGETVEKKVYKNGPQAKPLGNQAVKMHFEKNKHL